MHLLDLKQKHHVCFQKPEKKVYAYCTVNLLDSPFIFVLVFPAGSVVKSLVGFHNTGDKPYIVKNVVASLRNIIDHSYILQNVSCFIRFRLQVLTLFSTSVTTMFKNLIQSWHDSFPQHNITLLWTVVSKLPSFIRYTVKLLRNIAHSCHGPIQFKPFESLEPRDVTLELVVYYMTEEEEYYLKPAYNATIESVLVKPISVVALLINSIELLSQTQLLILERQENLSQPWSLELLSCTLHSTSQSLNLLLEARANHLENDQRKRTEMTCKAKNSKSA